MVEEGNVPLSIYSSHIRTLTPLLPTPYSPPFDLIILSDCMDGRTFFNVTPDFEPPLNSLSVS